MSATNEKAALAGCSLNQAKYSVVKPISPGERVKLEARQHFVRWLETGQGYRLRLARACWYALRKARRV